MRRPFKMWTRSWHLLRSNSDLRRITSIRWWTKFPRRPGRLRIFGGPVHDREVGSRETGLERRVFVQVVEDDRRDHALFQLEDDPDAVLVGLIADVADAVDLLVLDHLGDSRNPLGLVDLVREFGDDDPVAPVSAIGLFDLGDPADHDPALAGSIVIPDAFDAHQDAAGREVRALHDLEEFLNRNIRFVEEAVDGCTDLAEVVRRHLGRHPDCDTVGPVDEEVRDLRGEDGRFFQ